MDKTNISICNKCQGPVTLENGEYTCVLCGTNYGKEEADGGNDFKSFFKNTSIERLMEIRRILTNQTYMYGHVDSSKGDDRPTDLVAHLSSGQNYVRRLDSNFQYYGTCAVENWYNVKKVTGAYQYTVGIGADGTLQPTQIQIEELFNRLKEAGIGDMRMKQILDFSYAYEYSGLYGKTHQIEDSFIGLDIHGKVKIYNPWEIFFLDKNDTDDQKALTTMLKEIKSWPAIEQLYLFESTVVGITKQGTTFTASYSDWGKKCSKKVNQWDNIDDIAYFYLDDDACGYIGLKNDGTLVSNMSEELLKHFTTKELSKQRNIIQIAKYDVYNNYRDEEKLSLLTNRGEFIINSKKVADNVIAILPRGYVHADGRLFELVNEKKLEFKPIEDLKLFDSAETLVEDYNKTTDLKAILEENKNNLLDIINEKKKELEPLQNQYAKLGIFKSKERKELRPSIVALTSEIKDLESELKEIDNDIKNFPDGKAIWNIPEEQKSGYVSHDDLKNAVHNAVSYKKSGKSVVGSAAVGALVAGPAGAVVGAIYAADKNRKH